MSDIEFWEGFYSNHEGVNEPSNFAQYIIEKYNPVGSVLELGCGNGRDSVFFAKNKLQVTGIDQCNSAISTLKNMQIPNAIFHVGDFTNLPLNEKYKNVYSRFTLHSVNEADASRTMQWVYNVLENDGLFMIEVRSVNDELYGVGESVGKDAWVTDHYRRFLRLDEITEELKGLGFKIDLQVEGRGYAPYQGSDPLIIRVVCRK